MLRSNLAKPSCRYPFTSSVSSYPASCAAARNARNSGPSAGPRSSSSGPSPPRHSSAPAEARLHPLEVRQAVRVVPVFEPPALEVERVAALEDHPVDRARAAEHLAARVVDPPAVHERLGLGLVLPVVEAVADRERERRRHVDVEVPPGVRPPRLEHEHARARVLGQPRGERGARRAAADDDVVPLGHATTIVCSSVNDSIGALPPTRPIPLAVPGAAAEGKVRLPVVRRVVDVDPARAHGVGVPQPLGEVAREDRREEAVRRRVREPDRLVERADLDDGRDRPEGLLLRDERVGRHAVEHRRLPVEVGREAPSGAHRRRRPSRRAAARPRRARPSSRRRPRCSAGPSSSRPRTGRRARRARRRAPQRARRTPRARRGARAVARLRYSSDRRT